MTKIVGGINSYFFYSYCYRNSEGEIIFGNDLCFKTHPFNDIKKDKWKTLLYFCEISRSLYYELLKSDK